MSLGNRYVLFYKSSYRLFPSVAARQLRGCHLCLWEISEVWLSEYLIWHTVGPTCSYVFGVVAKLAFWIRLFWVWLAWRWHFSIICFLGFSLITWGIICFIVKLGHFGKRWAPAPCQHLSSGWFFFSHVSHGGYVWRCGLLPRFSSISFFFNVGQFFRK